MKNLTAAQQERVRLFKATLNKSSKWYNQDLNDFISNVSKEDAAKSNELIGRMTYMRSAKFEKEIAKEENRMLKAGLYETGNMTPTNALD